MSTSFWISPSISMFFPQYFFSLAFSKPDILTYYTISRTKFRIAGCYTQDGCVLASLIILITSWIFQGSVGVPLATRGCSGSCWIWAKEKRNRKTEKLQEISTFFSLISFPHSTALPIFSAAHVSETSVCWLFFWRPQSILFRTLARHAGHSPYQHNHQARASRLCLAAWLSSTTGQERLYLRLVDNQNVESECSFIIQFLWHLILSKKKVEMMYLHIQVMLRIV